MAKRTNGKTTSAVSPIDAIVASARTVTPTNIIDMVKRNIGTYTTPTRNVGRYTGSRVTAFQNMTMGANAGWQLDDCQLLFVWACEFPMAVGRVFAVNGRMGAPDVAAIRDGIGIVRGVRSDYNRTGHGDPAIPHGPDVKSVAYGPSRFDGLTVAPKSVAADPTPAAKSKTAKPAARKRAA